jgi:hypothetical protein
MKLLDLDPPLADRGAIFWLGIGKFIWPPPPLLLPPPLLFAMELKNCSMVFRTPQLSGGLSLHQTTK